MYVLGNIESTIPSIFYVLVCTFRKIQDFAYTFLYS